MPRFIEGAPYLSPYEAHTAHPTGTRTAPYSLEVRILGSPPRLRGGSRVADAWGAGDVALEVGIIVRLYEAIWVPVGCAVWSSYGFK